MLVANALSALSYFFFNDLLLAQYPSFSLGVSYLYGLFSLLNVVLAFFLFLWKRWAFFAFCGSSALIFIVNLIVGVSPLVAVMGLLGPVVLYLILKPKWNLLE